MNGMSILIIETPESSLAPPIMQQHGGKVAVYEPGHGLSLDTESLWLLELWFPSIQSVRHTFLLFTSHLVQGILLEQLKSIKTLSRWCIGDLKAGCSILYIPKHCSQLVCTAQHCPLHWYKILTLAEPVHLVSSFSFWEFLMGRYFWKSQKWKLAPQQGKWWGFGGLRYTMTHLRDYSIWKLRQRIWGI